MEVIKLPRNKIGLIGRMIDVFERRQYVRGLRKQSYKNLVKNWLTVRYQQAPIEEYINVNVFYLTGFSQSL